MKNKIFLVFVGLLFSSNCFAVDFARRFSTDTALPVVTSAANTTAATGSSLTMNTGKLLGRNSASVGPIQEITLGTNLSFSGTTLNAASGGSPGGSNTQVQFNNSGSFDGDSDLTFSTDTLTSTKLVTTNITDNGTFKILETGSTPTKYSIFQGGDQAIDLTYTLPTAYPGGNGYALTSTTAGAMSWTNISSGGTPGGSDTQVQFNDGGSTFGGASALTYNKSTGYVGINTSTYNQALNINGNIEIQGTNFKLGDSAASVSGTSAIALGYSTAATADYSSAIGYQAAANGDSSSAIGRQSATTANGIGAVALGDLATTDSPYTVVSGQNASISDNANYSVVVGSGSHIGSGDIYSVIVGPGNDMTGAAGFCLGALNTMYHARSGVIGVLAATTAQRQLMIGATDGDHYLQTVLNGNMLVTNQIDSVTLTAQAVASQTADLFQATKSDGTVYTSLDANGLLNKYNSVSTTGWGVPAIYKSDRATGQTAAKTLAAYTVGAADGSFEVSANVLVTTATVHNFTVTCTYTDEGNTSRTATMPFNVLAGTFVTAITNAAGAVPYEGIPLHIRCKASTTITIASTGTFTTVAYNIEECIKQIA